MSGAFSLFGRRVRVSKNGTLAFASAHTGQCHAVIALRRMPQC
jgi:hypothetical protein